MIAELTTTEPRVDVVLGTSGDLSGEDTAIAAGADGFLSKPVTSLAVFQQAVLSNLPADRQPAGPRSVADEEILPDLIAFQDDMAHIADVLDDPEDEKTLDYVAQFIGGVARSAQDKGLEQAADALAQARASGLSVNAATSQLMGLVQQRLTRKLAI